MKVEVRDFLRLVENAKTLAMFDLEAKGLRGDYDSVIVASIKPYGEKPVSYSVKTVGRDKKLLRDVKAHLESMDCWVTYFGKGFDLKMLETRFLKQEIEPIQKKPHIDLFFQLKGKLLTARKSQGHLINWLELPEEKMSVSADVWAQVAAEPHKHIPTLIKRCESDVIGLENLYVRTRHLIIDIAR